MSALLLDLLRSLLCGVLGKYGERFTARPKLKFVKHSNKIRHTEGQGDVFEHDERSLSHFTISVVNDNTYTAKGCKVFLKRKAFKAHGSPVISLVTFEQLRWSGHGDKTAFKPLSLSKGMEAEIEIAQMQYPDMEAVKRMLEERNQAERIGEYPSHQWGKLLVRTSKGTNEITPLSESEGYYEMTLIATAEDCEPYEAHIRFVINFADQSTNYMTVYKVQSIEGRYDSTTMNFIDKITEPIGAHQ